MRKARMFSNMQNILAFYSISNSYICIGTEAILAVRNFYRSIWSTVIPCHIASAVNAAILGHYMAMDDLTFNGVMVL